MSKKTKRQQSKYPLLIRVLFSFWFYLSFLLIAGAFYLFGLIRYGGRRPKDWQRLAKRAIAATFFVGGVRVQTKGRNNIPKGTVIFAANHQSFLDGLLIFHAANRPLLAVTAPLSSFPTFFTLWFRRMGYVGVARDLFEELRYRDEALGGQGAIKEANKALKAGSSLLIFPEGRREFDHHLLPFYTGVARIAAASKTLVVPTTLLGADHFMPPESKLVTPVSISVTFKKPIALWENELDAFGDTVLLERLIAQRLPESYRRKGSFPHHTRGKRAVFFDLDGTLTRRNIYTLMVSRYLHEHRENKRIGDVLRLIEKRFLLTNSRFFRYAIRLLRGMRPEDFTKDMGAYLTLYHRELFYPSMLALLEKHRERGNLIFIISEEPQEFLAPVAEFLKCPAFGTTMLHHPDGTFTGRAVGPLMRGVAKHEQLLRLAHQYHIDLAKSFAYGNSPDDYLMLRTVGHANVVNPPHKLKRRAKALGMRVIHEQ